jgi:hypothetical protein
LRPAAVTHVIAAITSQGLSSCFATLLLRVFLSTTHNKTITPTTRSHRIAKEATTMVYIRQDKLPKLKEYKYSGVDHSLLSQYVLKPFYTHVVIKCFPMWMA